MKNQNNIQKNEKQKAKVDVYKIITDRIVELLEKGTIPWKQSWKSILPQNVVSKNSYRGFNKMFPPVLDTPIRAFSPSNNATPLVAASKKVNVEFR